MKPPLPPATSPDQPWLLDAWELLNQIELNAQRERQIHDARLNDEFKRIGISDVSLVDEGRRKAMLKSMPQWVTLLDVAENTYVKAAVAQIDEQVKTGVPPFFFATENRVSKLEVIYTFVTLLALLGSILYSYNQVKATGQSDICRIELPAEYQQCSCVGGRKHQTAKTTVLNQVSR